MAKSSCIPKIVVDKMKKAIADGDINIKDLSNMTSEERRNLFSDFTSSELAKEINASFEKAIISKQKNALSKWAKKTFIQEKNTDSGYEYIQKRINELDNLGVLDNVNADNYLSDLMADIMGISLSKEEIKNISDKADKLEELYNKGTDDGIPSVEYWKERKKMDDYIASLTPSSNLKIMTHTIARGNLLFSLKSPLTNIAGNTVNGIFESLLRRISSKTYQGLNGKFGMSYVKKVFDIYQKSGYDISRLTSIAEGQKRLGEDFVTSQGEGLVSKTGKFYEDIIFKQLMGSPDVVSSAIAFADSVDLSSTKIAKEQGLEGDAAKDMALKIFKDSVKLEPDTDIGKIVRAQAISDAKYSTYTNDGKYSDLAMAIRSALNNYHDDLRLGDMLMPFVKTPANVIQLGVDASGIGAFRGFFKLKEAMKEMGAGNGEPMKEVVDLFIKSGLGITLATVIAHMINPDDFIGEYDNLYPKEKQFATLKNASFNSIKIGDKYVSLDYFGPLAPAIVGMLYARKYGNDLPSKLYQYGSGVLSQALRVPGFKEFPEMIESINRTLRKRDVKDSLSRLKDDAISFIGARVIPAISYDFAKGIDPYKRDADRGIERVQAMVPGLSQKLPKKISQTTGEPLKSEGFVNSMLFGSRLKKADESKIISEFKKLDSDGFLPTISDISNSGRMKELKEQLGDNKFTEVITYYGTNYSKGVLRLINTKRYEKLTPESKSGEINKIRSESIERALVEFKYKKPKKEKIGGSK